MFDYAFKLFLQSIVDNECTALSVLGVGDPVREQTDVQPIGKWEGHIEAVNALVVLPDGSVVSGSSDKTLRRWDVSSGQCLGTWSGHTSIVTALAVLPDGSLVSGSEDKTLRRWDVSSGQCLSIWEGQGTVQALAVLPDGSLVSGGGDKTLQCWDVSTGQCLNTWKGHTDPVWALAVLPDGTLVSGSGGLSNDKDNTIWRWDISSGQCLGAWKGHRSWVKALVVLPDGSLVSGSYDKTLRRWDVDTGQCLGTWEGHTNSVEALAVLPDGSLVSGGWDKTLRRWDVASGQCLGTWTGHAHWVKALTVLPDGSLVSGSDDKTICCWSSVGPTFTAEQYQALLKALPSNQSSLQSLSITHVYLGEQLKVFLPLFLQHPALKKVVLEQCGLSSRDISRVLDALKRGVKEYKTPLKQLSVANNPGLTDFRVMHDLWEGCFYGDHLAVDKIRSMTYVIEGIKKEAITDGVFQSLLEDRGNEDKQFSPMFLWCIGLLYGAGIGVVPDTEKAQALFTKLRAHPLPPIKEFLPLFHHAQVFRKERGFRGFTVYHLIALTGDKRWYSGLQGLSHEEHEKWGLNVDIILEKDLQGLFASELARQQLTILAKVKGIKALSTEAQHDLILQCYSDCAKVLRHGEEEAQLARVLRAQHTQGQMRLDYVQRETALLKHIDGLRPLAFQEAPFFMAYAKLLQQLWRGKALLIGLKEGLKGTNMAGLWPSVFNPYNLRTPAQVLSEWKEGRYPCPKSLQSKLKRKGDIVYVKHYMGALKEYKQTYEKALGMHRIGQQGGQGFEQLLNAYGRYIALWLSLLKLKDKQDRANKKAYLLTTPTLLLQSDRAPCFIDDTVPEGSTLSSAQKLSYFLNAGMKIEGMVGAGTAPVFSIKGVHYKRYPHAPGVEYMVSSLGKVLAGEGATPTVLLKVIGSDGIPYPYQASHSVQGKDLQSVIQHHPECMDKIRSDNFSAVAVLGMLTDPQDGKPDNYMVEFQVDEQGKIMEIDILGIDNDIAFADVVVSKHVEGEKAGHHFINIKNVIYFFPQMHQPINPNFRETFLKREPEFILIEWLKGLDEKNKEYEALLSEGIFTLEEYSGDGKGNKRGLQLPIKVVLGTICTLYRKLCQMKAILTAQPTVTLWDLLNQVEPEVATHYATVKEQHPHEKFGCDIMGCITALYEENIPNGRELMWFRAQLDAGFTHTMTSVVLKTAEEFGFEDNRTATLTDCLWKLLRVLQYDRFTGVLAPVLYEELIILVGTFVPLKSLMDALLAHGCYGGVHWLWSEELVGRKALQNRCEGLKKYSLLHFFAEGKQYDAVKQLLREGVYSIDVVNGQGYTPLHVAASVGDSVMVELLLKQGADKTLKTSLGKTPLAMAESRMKQASNPGKYEGVIVCLGEGNETAGHQRKTAEVDPLEVIESGTLRPTQ